MKFFLPAYKTHFLFKLISVRSHMGEDYGARYFTSMYVYLVSNQLAKDHVSVLSFSLGESDTDSSNL